MDPQHQIIKWLQQDNARMAALRTVRRLGLNDWCLGAGFVRNLVWDRRHGYTEPTPLNDIDVIHFDAERADAERDRMLEARLQQWLPRPWSVKNQARMHLRGGRAPYRDSEEAISFWTEVETAIGARLNADDSITLVAPFGLAALFDDTITFNAKNGDRAAYAQRVVDKGWLQRWPRLRQVKI
ncbi:nucleotidyltransferase family protein [Serratia marcescens]|uniref:Nucleotidyltransferase family protein n=1 Tax=Serratia marcescens TaxID=615 RepID=A0A5C7CJ92_SERMA|nr:nucleotidyltransferase family protein [Serratia marcescens]TXE33628.1 nucleotidyltransferase family protein [Serratia marcescens]TXE55855.1 nucleotidyltransferase family protein [Serratia marcescens]HEJ9150357.1 nucleotidyltransferase family protein [Serratia marcescens]